MLHILDSLQNPFSEEEIHNPVQQLTKKKINRGNVVLVPKSQALENIGDLRPIRIINMVPKLISRILANRLRTKLHEAIGECRTTFVRGRFIATREVLHNITKSGQQSVFFKIDFSKTFDSINWKFLNVMLWARSFPDRWMLWITQLLKPFSSRLVISGDYFHYEHGVRQGNPLLPMLFILDADVLQRMVEAVSDLLLTYFLGD
jgi:Reverse transcriptase (RNA-dependent DNA polymerase)